ncbi:dynein regulatory complex subunit 6-like isoform X2 [Homarus americanus]|uniref:dynein regulatory complex subunit 6-like isoform X2 n=1 Tax=Homarus americanus TaxID=6706 RepID=UPI001C45D6E2|nr:dynein regulatory complex subunit 6-like isoform X2 [Homarus americanus]
MSVYFLPFEVLVNLFNYLGVSDLLAASCVCSLWREASIIPLADKVTIMITDDAAPAMETFQATCVPYRNWVFKEVDLSLCGVWGDWWLGMGSEVRSLSLHSTGMSQADFVGLLTPCTKLRVLNLNGSRSLFREGTLLSNPEDVKMLSASLKNVTRLHLACSRYLTDSLFSRLTSVVGSLSKLSLAGCQITFHEAIHRRFYPQDGRITESDHVLTFKHILKCIEENSSTLKELSLGRTIIDSEALYNLSKVPGLQLQSLHLMSCDQLSKSGIQLLCENQKSITDLDLSLCSRITDYAVLSVCQHLPNIKKLNLRRCQGITEVGIRALGQLKHLEELNISHLEAVTSESVEEALGKEPRPTLRVLNLASLPLSWKTVANMATLTPNLIHLDVSMCISGINDKSLQAICKSLTKLQILNINGCTPVSDIGLSGHGLGQNDPNVAETGLSLEALGIREREWQLQTPHQGLSSPAVEEPAVALETDVKDDAYPFKVQLGSRAEKVLRQEEEVKRYLLNNVEDIVKSSEYGVCNLIGLRELNLCGCKKITNVTLVHAFNFRELQYLNLSHCYSIGEAGLEAMARHCPSLEVLMLAECGQTTDQVILVIAHYLRRIKTLDLQMCVQLTDDALDSLSNCHTLQYLDVSGCDRMSLEQVRFVQGKIPRLLNFHHRGVREKGPSEMHMEELPSKFTVQIPPPPPLFSKLKRKGARR